MSFDCITLSSDSSLSSSPHLADLSSYVSKGNPLYDEESREFHRIKEDTGPMKAGKNLFYLSDSDSDSNLIRSNSMDSIERLKFNRIYEDPSPVKTNSNVFSLSDTDSDSNNFSQSSSLNSLATSSLKANNFDDVSTQQKRKKGTKLSAEEKNRLKSMKLAEKNALKASKDYQRSLQPKECLKYVTAIIDSTILKFESMRGLDERLLEKEVKFKINSQTVQGIVTWTREIIGTQNYFGSNSMKEEDHVLLCVSAGEITRLVLDETLTSYVASMKDLFPGKHITLVLCGMEDYIKAGKEKRGGKVGPKPQVFRKTLEVSLVNIQLIYSIGHRTVENCSEFALLILMFTKAVAETPFKRDRQERERGGVLSWFAQGDSKDCVRVSNTGTGCSLLWHQQLRQFNNVGLDVAKAVTSVYASPRALFKMNPQHCVPTLNDNGFILWESRAIMAYLINKYGSEEDRERLLPSDPEARAKVDWMWYFDIGCLYKSISDYYLPQLMSGESPEHQKANALKQNLDYLEIYLEETPYVSGETMTAADLSVLASVTHLESVDFRYEGYANVAAWAKKLKAELPYYNACNKEGIETFQKWAKTRLAVKKTK